jgi:uncharacterized protein (UPF0332 family)
MAEALSPEFKECLERGRIRRFASGRELAPQELKQAAQDLKAAGESYRAGGFKWSTIQSYYAMFHTARALLYQAGYRERSHFCLIVALRELYVSRRKVDLRFVEALQLGKSLRENADYYGRFSGEGAGKMLADARAFLRAARALLSAEP